MEIVHQIEDAGTVILKVLGGSRAYGLEDSESDFDYHGVFVVPTKDFFKLDYTPPESAWIEGEDQDNIGWEIGHFCKKAIHANPTMLETLVAPVEYADDNGMSLRSMLPFFLARTPVYESYKNYAHKQRTKMFEYPGGKMGSERLAKYGIQYIRNLYHGTELLTRGTFNPRIIDAELHAYFMQLKRATEFDYGELINKAQEWERHINLAYRESPLPVQADVDSIFQFLLQIRKEYL